jgi:diguanylate cyclase (GGDEF)-like protein/PAS domain S-box-containing protein
MKRPFSILAVLAVVVVLRLAGALEFLEQSWMDAGFGWGNRAPTSDVVFVEIDGRAAPDLAQASGARSQHARVLRNLTRAGARRVGLDLDLASRGAPAEDADLAEAIQAAPGRVVLPVIEHAVQARDAVIPPRIPLAEFARAATLGSIDLAPDSDGLVRRYPGRGMGTSGPIPSFAAALAGQPPTSRDFYLDYGIDVASIPRLSYSDVLDNQFEPGLVRDKIVIVGSSVEPADQVAVPIAGRQPGPLLEVLAYECLTRNRALVRPGLALGLLVALLAGLLVDWWLHTWSWRAGLLLVASCCSVVLLAAVVVQRLLPVILDIGPSVVVVGGLYAWVSARRIEQQAVGFRRQEGAMRRTETLMHHVVQNSFDAIVIIGDDGIVESFNHKAETLFACPPATAPGSRLADFLSPAEPGGDGSLLVRATDGPVEAIGRRRDGATFPVELVVTAIDAAEEPRLVAVVRDITERKAHQERLKHQATHDPLTDLPNRLLLRHRIERALKQRHKRGRVTAVLLLDLDRFKEINDALGHRTGDLLLKEVAQRLKVPLEPGDTLARLGGDEFSVLIHDAPLERVLHTGWKLIETLRLPFEVEGFALHVDTSLGVSLFPDHGPDAETLLQRADVAMYVAKRQRSGLAVYHPSHDFNHKRHLTLRAELRTAIEDDSLTMYYQPKVEAETDRVVALEALVRWRHPTHGLIPPDEFITLAEHCGLIRPLTQWVLKSVLRQGAEWRREGLDLGISVNLSARNLLEEDLPLNLGCMMTALDFPPAQLTLEITESVLMEDPERALRIVTRLHDLGVGISVDDFGTGYSSLAYLIRLPTHELKIDKSFVMRMEQDAGSATIVHSTIDLAHNLDLIVVAEGVETETIWKALKEQGCDIGQGYFFSRPVPAADVPKLVKKLNEPPAPDWTVPYDERELVASAVSSNSPDAP